MTIFADFYGITSDTIFLAICLCRKLFNTIFEMCEELGAQRAPNEGPKGPQMPSAGARRKGP